MRQYSYLVFLLLFLFAACKEDAGSFNFLVDVGLNLRVISPQGDDLLDPENGSIDASKVMLSRVLEDDLEDSTVELINYEDQYAIKISALSTLPAGIQTMYLTWPGSEVDTIVAELEKGNNYIIASKFWYNGVLIYEDGVDNVSEHTIVR